MNRGRGKVAVGENEPLKSACWGFAFKWSERERGSWFEFQILRVKGEWKWCYPALLRSFSLQFPQIKSRIFIIKLRNKNV